jgi:hypothetical protein
MRLIVCLAICSQWHPLRASARWHGVEPNFGVLNTGETLMHVIHVPSFLGRVRNAALRSNERKLRRFAKVTSAAPAQ